MKNNNRFRVILLLVLGFVCVNANAVALYDNGVTAFDSYAVSQPSADQLVWDDFSFGTPVTITGIQWRGTYSTYSPQQDNFYIQIFADNSGGPDTNALYSLPFGNNVNRTEWIGNPNPGNQTYIFNYSVDISPINLSAGTYWLSIFDDFASDDPQRRWAWIHQFDPNTGNEVIKNTLINYSQHYPYDADFTLTGVASVPLPSSVWLFGSGLVGIRGLMRRHNKKDHSECL